MYDKHIETGRFSMEELFEVVLNIQLSAKGFIYQRLFMYAHI